MFPEEIVLLPSYDRLRQLRPSCHGWIFVFDECLMQLFAEKPRFRLSFRDPDLQGKTLYGAYQAFFRPAADLTGPEFLDLDEKVPATVSFTKDFILIFTFIRPEQIS
jgi:hypothetical protein